MAVLTDPRLIGCVACVIVGALLIGSIWHRLDTHYPSNGDVIMVFGTMLIQMGMMVPFLTWEQTSTNIWFKLFMLVCQLGGTVVIGLFALIAAYQIDNEWHIKLVNILRSIVRKAPLFVVYSANKRHARRDARRITYAVLAALMNVGITAFCWFAI